MSKIWSLLRRGPNSRACMVRLLLNCSDSVGPITGCAAPAARSTAGTGSAPRPPWWPPMTGGKDEAEEGNWCACCWPVVVVVLLLVLSLLRPLPPLTVVAPKLPTPEKVKKWICFLSKLWNWPIGMNFRQKHPFKGVFPLLILNFGNLFFL